MKWKNIKIRNKLAISFGLLVFLMSVIIYNSLSSINNIVSNAKNVESADHIKLLFTERYADHLKWANKVSFALQNTNETSVNVETNPHNCAFGKWFYGTGRQEAESFVPEIKPVLDSMEEIHNKLHSTAEEINTFLSRGDRVGALNVFNTKTTVYLHEIGLKFHSINGIISQNNEKTDQSYQADVKAEKTGLVILGLAAILASIVFTWLITFSFTKGINATVKASRQIANGNLEIKIDSYWLDRKDEIGDLLRSFRTMADKLKTVVVSIINSSEIIATAGQQVSSATQQLSQGANEQASAVEEISSSVEQMTSNTHQNAENAHHAEKVASLASTNIQQSNIAIKGSTNSMKAVASKISIIGDIAFQTNLLALNAAVEAARAGEHGRGFAVVAAEVRKLAERSRTATDEINILSKTGVETAENAARQFEEVVPEIDRTTKLVQEISAASGEQSSGINQISTSIQTLNHVTQQNAAASEEMSTSAEELANQAEELKELISYFKVDTNGKGSTHKTKAYFLHASDIKNDGKVVLPVKSGKDIAIQTNELKEHSDKDYEKF